MPESSPIDANKFIEEQLHSGLRDLGSAFQADILGFSGPLIYRVDDLLRESVEDLAGRSQDCKRLAVVLTTSGGYIEVVQRIVSLLRRYYEHVAFIVPNHAYSAGTVLVMSGNEIHMDYYSRLGPIDPQVQTPKGMQVPALGYLVQWERLLDKAREKDQLTLAEAQLMIDGFDQAELYKYEQERDLSVDLLKEWLVKYKFSDWTVTEHGGKPVTKQTKSRRAVSIGQKLNNTKRWHTHGHGISMEVLRREVGLRINDLEDDQVRWMKLRAYHSLSDDYMNKMRRAGTIHTAGKLVPIYV